MLPLPDGNVLFSDAGFSSAGSRLFLYQPDCCPVPAGKPVINSITVNGDGSFHLVGTRLNGMSQGAAFGDDSQMDSNYPLVRVTDAGGNVYYLPTYNWSSTGVQTGSKPVSTEFFTPSTLPPAIAYSLVVVATGISSDPVTFYGPVWVDFNSVNPTQSGSFDAPYHTLSQAVNAVPSTGSIIFKTSGSNPSPITICKAVTLSSRGGAVTIGQ
jgi:hypothetical protein